MLFLAGALLAAVQRPRTGLKVNNFETASAYLMQAKVQRLVFLWDNPVARAMDPRQLADVGGFFFERAGLPIPVTPLVPSQDAGFAAQIESRRRPGTGLIWLYDLNVVHAVARRQSPGPGPGWTCRNFGAGPIGVLACTPR
jgi:hypothetical protein